MFLRVTLERNPALVEAAVDFHQRGVILPNTYVLDVDAIQSNAHQLAQKARQVGVTLYMMTKQIGRNPELARLIAASGIKKAVAVDPWEAVTLAEAGIALGNVGHLVQIPSHMIETIMRYQPEVITVFSVQAAELISKVAQRLGIVQKILLKVVGERDVIYEGQQGGIPEKQLLTAAGHIRHFPGVIIAGITAFPCFLYNDDSKEVHPTENARTVKRCAERLTNQLGITLEQINMPSATMVTTLPQLADLGATHGEPGHALTGTTPLHQHGHQPELPSMVYVSEVSHVSGRHAYTFGGGFYRRSHKAHAIVGKTFTEMRQRLLPVRETPPEYIDYYGMLDLEDQSVDVGDTVIYAFRTQVFVTRSEVALIEGIQSGKPTVKAIYDSLGRRLR